MQNPSKIFARNTYFHAMDSFVARQKKWHHWANPNLQYCSLSMINYVNTYYNSIEQYCSNVVKKCSILEKVASFKNNTAEKVGERTKIKNVLFIFINIGISASLISLLNIHHNAPSAELTITGSCQARIYQIWVHV